MEITKNVCDRCKCEIEENKSFSIFKDRKADAAGSMENWYYTFDLCHECKGTVLARIFNEQPEESYEVIKKLQVKTRIG